MPHYASSTSRFSRGHARGPGALAAWLLCALLGAGLLTGLTGCQGSTVAEQAQPAQAGEPAGQDYPVTVVHPDGLGLLDTAQTTASGETIGVRCSTCHEDSDPLSQPPKRKADQFTEFHTEMNFAHGPLDCQSCHAPADRDRLRLASGDTIAFAEVMELCAQCHGPQSRDWRRGSHGGMNGYWDKSRGPRTRNSCVNCHDPHAPAFPQVMPVHPPRDRFLSKGHAAEEHH